MTFTYWFARFVVRIGLKIFYRHRTYGTKPAYEGAAIFAPNHASHLDPPIVGCSWPGVVHFLGRGTLFVGERWSKILTNLNTHPISKDGVDLKTMKVIINLLKEGNKTVIFPEGTRTRDGNMQPPQDGVAMLALRGKAAIIPVYIHGSYDAYSPHMKRPKLWGKTACVFGNPIDTTEYSDMPRREAQTVLTERVMYGIKALKKWYDEERKGPIPKV